MTARLTFEALPEDGVPDDVLVEVVALLETAERHDRHPPLSEHHRLALERGQGSGLLARLDDSRLAAYAHVSPHSRAVEVQVVVHPDERRDPFRAQFVREALLHASDRSGAPVRWWAFCADEADTALARSLDLDVVREVVQMRRSLPHPEPPAFPPGVDVRSFVPGADDAVWLEVNARAFADHPDQGRWGPDDLTARMDEPWFDPDGFLVAEDREGMAGFCWTKLPGDGTGEIYVIGTHPRWQGRGLGKALVLAGLAHMSERGAGEVTLYVEADNEPARALYETLGFDVDHVDRVYEASP